MKLKNDRMPASGRFTNTPGSRLPIIYRKTVLGILMKNDTDHKLALTGKEGVLKALEYEHVDQIPVDLGGTLHTGTHVSFIADLRRALGLDKPGTTVKRGQNPHANRGRL